MRGWGEDNKGEDRRGGKRKGRGGRRNDEKGEGGEMRRKGKERGGDERDGKWGRRENEMRRGRSTSYHSNSAHFLKSSIPLSSLVTTPLSNRQPLVE